MREICSLLQPEVAGSLILIIDMYPACCIAIGGVSQSQDGVTVYIAEGSDCKNFCEKLTSFEQGYDSDASLMHYSTIPLNDNQDNFIVDYF